MEVETGEYRIESDRNFTHDYPVGSTVRFYRTDQTETIPEVKTVSKPSYSGESAIYVQDTGRKINVGDQIGVRQVNSFEKFTCVAVSYVTEAASKQNAKATQPASDQSVKVTLDRPLTTDVTLNTVIEHYVAEKTTEAPKKDNGLSAGAIAGIVCGSVAGLLLVVGLIYLARMRNDGANLLEQVNGNKI